MDSNNKFLLDSGEIYEQEYIKWRPGAKHRELIFNMELHNMYLMRDNKLFSMSEGTEYHEQYEEKEVEFNQNLSNVKDERFPPFTLL